MDPAPRLKKEIKNICFFLFFFMENFMKKIEKDLKNG